MMTNLIGKRILWEEVPGDSTRLLSGVVVGIEPKRIEGPCAQVQLEAEAGAVLVELQAVIGTCEPIRY